MRIIHAFLMTLSMFTRIPTFYHKWDEKAKPLMLLMLPFVGLIIGGLWYLVFYLLSLTKLNNYLSSLIISLFPLFITGFIHFDGYMDVIDATHSYKSIEERRMILKDSHVGSFAVVYAIILILAQYLAFISLNATTNYLILIFIPIVSRIMSALSLYIFKPMAVSEYHNEEKDKYKGLKIVYLIILLITCFVLAFIFLKYYCFVLIFLALIHFLFVLMARNNLKGLNGDICGYALVISELSSIILIVILELYSVL